MATKTGVVRERFTIVQLETDPDQIRTEYPDGAALRITSDEGVELAVRGRAHDSAFASPDIDSLYLSPVAAGADPRAALEACRRWSWLMAALPLVAIAVSYL